jgi:hypothetical protein
MPLLKTGIPVVIALVELGFLNIFELLLEVFFVLK